jgi:uncharacterized Fe-S radical SAM superfamily protein PflX
LPPDAGGQKLARARELLASCRACERRCGNNRLADERRRCGLGVSTRVVTQRISITEEPEVIPVTW